MTTKHDTNKPRMSLFPLPALMNTVAVLEFGAAKYGDNNWRTVPNADTRYYDAAMRHMLAHRSGEGLDKESGLPHLAHAMCCLAFMQSLPSSEVISAAPITK